MHPVPDCITFAVKQQNLEKLIKAVRNWTFISALSIFLRLKYYGKLDCSSAPDDASLDLPIFLFITGPTAQMFLGSLA